MWTTLIAVAPVVLFLLALARLDTFQLVRPSWIAAAVATGAAAAGVSLAVNEWFLTARHVPVLVVSGALAPILEEILKSLPIVVLVLTGRIAFLVDAAIDGFAVGTGFALVENLWYLHSLGSASLMLWIVRGFGTAMLQGATTTMFAVIARTLADRAPGRAAMIVAPGLIVAILIHAAFNIRVLPPAAEMLVILGVLPILVIVVFDRSERATREWIGAGLDLDIELLGLITSDAFSVTRFGRYLQELRARVPGPQVVDMMCLLRVELEIAIQAKALLIARNAGLELAPGPDLDAALDERRALQASIGRAGLLALRPLQITSHRDAWHRQLLSSGSRSHRASDQ